MSLPVPSIDPRAKKTFDDVERYESEIALLVPGYELLHAMVPIIVGARFAGPRARGLVVGCGPGHELVALARQVPTLSVDAIDPSPAMVSAAERNVALAGLDARVRVHRATLLEYAAHTPYDVVVALLVSHFVPDDGARQAFVSKMAASLRTGGIALTAEIADDGAFGARLREGHVAWAERGGMTAERAATMRERLRSGFAALDHARHQEIGRRAGLQLRGELFRCFAVTGSYFEKTDG